MKNIYKIIGLLVCFIFGVVFAIAQESIPHLTQKGTATQLIVDGEPYLICGGELGNSTATTVENMEPVWSKLTAMNLNTVLIPVYWELVEAQEGKFDFSLYRALIDEARRRDLKIVLLWFGSWKNSMSSHAPAWVKTNQEKYPRVKDETGRSQEILSSFSENVLAADRRGFERLMLFLKEYDSEEHTVIMVQIENEIGMLPSARDYQALAEKAFRSAVPAALLAYMQEHKDRLAPEFLAVWRSKGYQTKGTWEEVFGQGVHTYE